MVTKCFHHEKCDLIVLKLSSLYLCFAYCRNGSSRVGIDMLLREIKLCCPSGARLLIIGDLNAKSSFLPNPITNMAGRVLDRFLSSNEEFMIVNQKVPTFFRRNRNNSTLDLCIISESLAQSLTDCSTLDQFDSDHKPVLCRFDLRRGPKMLMLPLDSYYQDMYPVRAANIRLIPDEFGSLLEKELVKVDSQIGDAPDDLWMSIEQSIIFVLKRMKLLRRKSRCIRKPWFSPEIRQLILQSNHNRTRENAAAVKKAIRTAKNNITPLLSQFTIAIRNVRCG